MNLRKILSWRGRSVFHKCLLVASVVFFVLCCFIARPMLHLFCVAWTDLDERAMVPSGYIDDASRLNATQVDQVWSIPVSDDLEMQMRELLAMARAQNKRVSIAGARHSLGGHVIYPGGIVINTLTMNKMLLHKAERVLKVQAGATWKDILSYLDQEQLSVAVMQSNNSFSVGGSVSANCHGWQCNRPPIASTVRAFRIMLADGTIQRCSRDENRELFSLALGGYGLFGVILDVDLDIVDNKCYKRGAVLIDSSHINKCFTGNDGVEMLYGRLNVNSDSFLEEAIIYTCRVDDAVKIPVLAESSLNALKRIIFRGTVDSAYGKQLRWKAETNFGSWQADDIVSRNSLLNQGVEVYENRTSDSTDVIHEYFIPEERVPEFIADVKRIVPIYSADLLNVTLRQVNEDNDTYLRYADKRMTAFVMLFVQARDLAGETDMEKLTCELIDASLARGGRYYLPYRLHASKEQFQAAYPQATDFFKLKLKYDPDELFQNKFYLKYAP